MSYRNALTACQKHLLRPVTKYRFWFPNQKVVPERSVSWKEIRD
jgi:hypothetical protein